MSPPPTVEPPQQGVRRIELLGPTRSKIFKIAYHAPSVTDPDYPAFLLVQQVLAGGRGINFGQNEFGDAVLPTSRLAGIADDLATWFPPQAVPYVFTLAGSIGADASTADIETRLQAAIDALISEPPAAEEMETARRRLLDELVFDRRDHGGRGPPARLLRRSGRTRYRSSSCRSGWLRSRLPMYRGSRATTFVRNSAPSGGTSRIRCRLHLAPQPGSPYP